MHRGYSKAPECAITYDAEYSVLTRPSSRWLFAITLAGFAEVVASGLAIAAASSQAPLPCPPPRRASSDLVSLGLAGPPLDVVSTGRSTHQPVMLPVPATRTCDACGVAHRDSPQGKAAHARYCARRSPLAPEHPVPDHA